MTAAPEMTDVEIEGEFQVYKFRGVPLGPGISTRLDQRGRQRARWMKARLYLKDDGTYRLYQVSYSTVWHLPGGGGHVQRPQVIPSGALGQDAVYCGVMPPKPGREQCPPPDITDKVRDPFGIAASKEMKRPAEVIIELPQHKIWTYPDATAVIARMTTARHRGDGTTSSAVSGPMRQLLADAALIDPAFAAAGKPVIEL